MEVSHQSASTSDDNVSLQVEFLRNVDAILLPNAFKSTPYLFDLLSVYLERSDPYYHKETTQLVETCKESIHNLLGVILARIPLGDTELLQRILNLLRKLEFYEYVKILLKFIPKLCLIALQGNSHNKYFRLQSTLLSSVSDILERINDNSLLHSPVLKCLTSLRVNDDGRQKILETMQSALRNSPSGCLHESIRYLLAYPMHPEDVVPVFKCIRRELESKSIDKQISINILEAFIVTLGSSSKHSIWAAKYLELVGEMGTDDLLNVTEYDVALLLMLSQETEYATGVAATIVSWLSSEDFPFETFKKLIELASNDESNVSEILYSEKVYRHFSVPLIRLSSLLLLSITNICCDTPAVESLILFLYRRLGHGCRVTLAQTVLQISEESLKADAYDDNVNQNSAESLNAPSWPRISQSANLVLRRMVEEHPGSMSCLKPKFISMLQSSRFNTGLSRNIYEDESIRDICSILLLIFEADIVHKSVTGIIVAKNELLVMTQKMIDTTVQNCTLRNQGSTELIRIRGILLGAAIIQSGSFTMNDKKDIKDLIVKAILPDTFCVPEPSIGSLCLRFLRKYYENTQDVNDLFGVLRLLLSNTGLIQKSLNDRPDSIIGYRKAPSLHSLTQQVSKRTRFTYCVHFYIRRTSTYHPSSWMADAHWIFNLMDSYLQIARKRSDKWKSNDWVNAEVEFPNTLMEVETHIPSNAQPDWLKNLLSFEFDSLPNKEGTQFLVEQLSKLNDNQLKDIKDSLFRFQRSLMVCDAIYNAVLKNTFEYSRVTNQEEFAERNIEMMKRQCTKIYSLRAKSNLLQTFMTLLVHSIRRRRSKTNTETEHSTQEHFNSMSPVQADIASCKQGINGSFFAAFTNDVSLLKKTLKCRQFTDFFSLDTDIYWECLMDVTDFAKIRCYLQLHVDLDTGRIKEEAKFINELVLLKRNIATHISKLADDSTTHEKSRLMKACQFTFCLTETFAILDDIARLRQIILHNLKELTDDSTQLFNVALISMGESFLRLLFSTLKNGCKDMKSLVFYCDQCPALTSRLRNTSNILISGTSSDGQTFAVLNKVFVNFLVTTADPVIANAILEVLSVLSLHDANRECLEEVVDLNWTALRTVYVTSNSEYNNIILPYAFHEAIKSEKLQSVPLDKFSDPPHQVNEYRGSNLRQGVLRHWGLLCSTRNGIDRLARDFLTLSEELASFLKMMYPKLGRYDETKHSKKKMRYAPKLVGLDLYTFPFLFEWAIQLTPGMGEIFQPGSCPTSTNGPYHQAHQIFYVFDRLATLYTLYLTTFPRRTATAVVSTSKSILSVSKDVLHRCIAWRAAQPLIPIEHIPRDTVDTASVVYIQDLVEAISSLVIVPILALCDSLQSMDSAIRSNSAALRLAATEAERYLDEIANSYSFERIGYDNTKITHEMKTNDETVGFHQLYPTTTVDESNKSDEVITNNYSPIENSAAIKLPALHIDTESDDDYGIDGYGLEGWVGHSDL